MVTSRLKGGKDNHSIAGFFTINELYKGFSSMADDIDQLQKI